MPATACSSNPFPSIETVRVTGAEARMQSAWEQSVAATARSGEDVQFWSTMSLTLAGTAQQFTSLLMIVAGVLLILDGQLSMGALIAANMLAGRVLAPISGIAAVITRATQTFSSLRAIDKLMRSNANGLRLRLIWRARSGVARSSSTTCGSSIQTRRQTPSTRSRFRSSPASASASSGASAPARRLWGACSRALRAREGSILIEGVDLRQYDPADLRRGIGFVLQDTDLFFGRLRDNIALGFPSATDEQNS